MQVDPSRKWTSTLIEPSALSVICSLSVYSPLTVRTSGDVNMFVKVPLQLHVPTKALPGSLPPPPPLPQPTDQMNTHDTRILPVDIQTTSLPVGAITREVDRTPEARPSPPGLRLARNASGRDYPGVLL